MKRWILLLFFVLGSPAVAAFECGTALKAELLSRLETDQSARKALVAAPSSNVAQDAVVKVDASNTAFMRDTLASCGWPKRSVVGQDAAQTAWLLVQHADMEPEFQVAAARQLKYAVLAKEADPQHLALLVDRNRRLSDLPQVYGMQFTHGEDGVVRFFDIVNPGLLDQRRREIGLPSFYCWVHEVASTSGDASVQWPAGVLFNPTKCADTP